MVTYRRNPEYELRALGRNKRPRDNPARGSDGGGGSRGCLFLPPLPTAIGLLCVVCVVVCVVAYVLIMAGLFPSGDLLDLEQAANRKARTRRDRPVDGIVACNKFGNKKKKQAR